MRALVLALVLSAGVAHAQDTARVLDLAVTPDLALAPDPEAPTVGAALDKGEAYVGDRLALTVTAIARAGIIVNLPSKVDLGKLEVLERDDGEAQGRDLGDGRRSFRFVLFVAVYEVGPTEVPPLPLTYLSARGDVRTVSTDPVSLTIKALVDESQARLDPQPARGPRTAVVEDRRIMRAIWVALGLLAFVVVASLARRARRAPLSSEGPALPARPPGEVAIERLTAIRAQGDFQRDGYRPFAFETAEVVRAYLGARYGFDSLELTSTELLVELARLAPHLVQPHSAVEHFLEESDLVKFANTGSTDGTALLLLDSAQSIVLSTAPKLETAQEMLSGPVRPPLPLSGRDS